MVPIAKLIASTIGGDALGMSPLVLTALIAVVAPLLYKLWGYATDLITRSFLISIAIDNEDISHEWVMKWLGDRGVFVSAPKVKAHVSWKGSSNRGLRNRNQQTTPVIELQPGNGFHIFTYKRRVFWLTNSTATTPITTGFDRSPFLYSNLRISTFGRDVSIFKELIETAMESCMEAETDETKIYVLNRRSNWHLALSRPTRSLSSVILEEGTAESVLSDAREFLDREEYYRARGVPYRRGYLLYGPPGCGKTSFVSALAGELKLNVCVLNLSDKNLDDKLLCMRLHTAPGRALVLLEDVDAVFVQRESASEGNSVTFSGLLNAIDGAASQEGKLFFMSTNHIEKLDPALLRAGRCDVKVKFDLASSEQAGALFTKFYSQTDPDSGEFSNVVADALESVAGSGKSKSSKHANAVATPSASGKHADAVTNPSAAGLRKRLGGSRDSGAGVGDGSDDENGGYAARTNAPSTVEGVYSPTVVLSSAELNALAKQFAARVPNRRVAMSALQGHLMKYKDSPHLALENYREVIATTEQYARVESVRVRPWLRRLGLGGHASAFERANVHFVSQLNGIKIAALSALKVDDYGSKQRVIAMLEGNPEAKEGFRYATRGDAVSVFRDHFENIRPRPFVQLETELRSVMHCCESSVDCVAAGVCTCEADAGVATSSAEPIASPSCCVDGRATAGGKRGGGGGGKNKGRQFPRVTAPTTTTTTTAAAASTKGEMKSEAGSNCHTSSSDDDETRSTVAADSQPPTPNTVTDMGSANNTPTGAELAGDTATNTNTNAGEENVTTEKPSEPRKILRYCFTDTPPRPTPEQEAEFADCILPGTVSVYQLVDYLMKYGSTPQSALANIRELYLDPPDVDAFAGGSGSGSSNNGGGGGGGGGGGKGKWGGKGGKGKGKGGRGGGGGGGGEESAFSRREIISRIRSALDDD